MYNQSFDAKYDRLDKRRRDLQLARSTDAELLVPEVNVDGGGRGHGEAALTGCVFTCFREKRLNCLDVKRMVGASS